MKAILWTGFVLIAAFWTVGVIIAVQVTQWAIAAVESGGVAQVAEAAARIPIPAWLSPFLGLVGWREIMLTVAAGLELLSATLSSSGQSLSWIVPLIWVTWGLGLVGLLLLALLVSRIMER